MVIELTPQTIITAGAVVTAALLLVKNFAGGVRWFDKQERQSVDIKQLKEKHDADVAALENELSEEIRRYNNELQLLTYGVLACLKGLQEKGCNGPVTEAVNKIESYLNQKAHE
jgi:hypothetical protein